MRPSAIELRNARDALRRGGICVIPTDTMYGIVASALNEKAVRSVYGLRKRDARKPMIVLIGSAHELAAFGVSIPRKFRGFIHSVWPGKVSIVFPLPARNARRLAYLHRGTKTLAFRVPRPLWLREFLKHTGPLVAPSANPAGKPPAKSIREAKEYFGRRVHPYVNGGVMRGAPSTLVSVGRGNLRLLRQGAGKIASNVVR